MPLTAIIVGAGIGGLATAIALRRADFDVTILERRSSLTEVGYAIDVPPNATRILKHFGMDLKNLRGCHQIRLDVFKANVEPMLLLRSDDRNIGGDDPFLSVHRVDYHEALKDLALGEIGPGRPAKLIYNSSVVEYDAEKGVVSLHDGQTYAADLIIAADGNNSKAHRWIVGQDFPAEPTGLNNVRFVVPTDAMLQDEGMKSLVDRTRDSMCVYIDEVGNFIIHYACRDHTLQNFGLYQEDQPGNEDLTKHRKQDIARQRLSHINSTFEKIAGFVDEDGTYLWRIVERDPLEKLHSGRLVLVGDAAHPMLPKMGQGAAQAVEDAAVLGVLLEGLSNANSIHDRLRLWEKLRYPRASAIQLMSRTTPSVEHWPNPEDEKKAAKFFPPGELPTTRSAMTLWAFRYDAVAEAKAALGK